MNPNEADDAERDFKELETVMERACNNLSKGTFADLDNKTVNWPLLFLEVGNLILARDYSQHQKWLKEVEEPPYTDHNCIDDGCMECFKTNVIRERDAAWRAALRGGRSD